MNSRQGIIAAILILIVSGTVYGIANRERLYLDHLAGQLPEQSLLERQSFLTPYIYFSKPTIEKDRYPVVVQFHGCAGHRDKFMDHWASVAHEAGFMAVSVDSNSPRGFNAEKSLAIICEGKALLGQERTGDILAALDLIAKRPDVDPSKIVIAGWSHGAWAVMDSFAMDFSKRPPAGIHNTTISMPKIAGAILFYPYCGQGAWSRINGWSQTPPTLAFVAGQDTVVSGPECKNNLEKLNKKGADIDIVYYENADHIFDDPTRPDPTKVYYDETSALDSIEQYRSFLRAIDNAS